MRKSGHSSFPLVFRIALLAVACFAALSVTQAGGRAELSSIDYQEVFCGVAILGPSETAFQPPLGPLNVSIAGFAFNPQDLTINVGDTVTWTNNDGRAHTSTSDTGVWDSNAINPGQTFSFQFNSPGTFPYHCSIHTFMTGTITVQPGSMHNVSISGFAFNPSNLVINVGDTVTWTNKDGSTHTSTSDTGVWDSNSLGMGQTFSFQFNEPGQFPYHCSIHTFMTASITVMANSTPTDTPPDTPTNTPTDTPTATSTSTNTATNTPTSMATDTPTPTATPTGGPTPSVSGVITYGNAVGNPPPPRFIRNVAVQSTSGSPAVGPVITGTPGTYVLTGFGSGAYTIKPSKPSGPNTAITSADAARVAQGVAGTNPFVSQNMRFAADTTGNGGPNPVSSQDAAFIARFAAGLTGFGRTGQWFFFLTGAPSPMPTAPATYNDSRSYASVTGDNPGQDYVAVLVGEVSGNYNPANNARPALGPEGTTSVELPQITTGTGKEILIPIRVGGAGDKNIASYEFDLRYDPGVIQPLADPADVAKTASRGLSVVVNPYQPGLLRVVVYGAYPIDSDGVLMYLRFTTVGGAGTVSQLTFERIMFNEGEPDAAVSNGLVRLSN